MKMIIPLLTVLLFTAPAGHAMEVPRIRITSGFDKPVLQAGRAENLVISVGLSADKIHRSRRVPLNLAIVIDRSGSMQSQGKIDNARAAAIDIIERLSPTDIVALVAYDTTAEVLVSARNLNDKDHFIRAIRQIRPGGSTALYDGIRHGASEVKRFASNEFLNRVILLSDGLANQGPQTTPELAGLGSRFAEDGIAITTVGVGTDYNEDLMGALASSGGGNIYFANDSDGIPAIFTQELGEAMTAAARDVHIRIDCARGITPLRSVGMKARVNGQSMELMIANLYGARDKNALFEVRLPSVSGHRTLEVARVTITYTDPFSGEEITERERLTVRIDTDPRLVEQAMNKDILKAVMLTRTSEIKEKAILLADQGQYAQADELLAQNSMQLEKTAQWCDNDAQLLAEAKQARENTWVSNAAQGLTNIFRKRTRSEAQSQINQQYAPGYYDKTSGFWSRN